VNEAPTVPQVLPKLRISRLTPERSGVGEFLRRLRRNPLSVTGLAIIVFFVMVAALAPVLAPPPRGLGTLAWAVPVLALASGLVLAWRWARRTTRAGYSLQKAAGT